VHHAKERPARYHCKEIRVWAEEDIENIRQANIEYLRTMHASIEDPIQVDSTCASGSQNNTG